MKVNLKDGWIAYYGDESTIDLGETEVEVIRRGPNSTHWRVAEAHHIDWHWTGGKEDVLYYRMA